MGFDLAIASGRVAALRDCPAGRQIEVNNDAVWHGTIHGRATVGAAALDVETLQEMVLFAPAPPAVAGTVIGTFAVRGTATLMRDGNLTRLTLDGLRLTATGGTRAASHP